MSVNSAMALVIIHSPRHLTIGRILVPLFWNGILVWIRVRCGVTCWLYCRLLCKLSMLDNFCYGTLRLIFAWAEFLCLCLCMREINKRLFLLYIGKQLFLSMHGHNSIRPLCSLFHRQDRGISTIFARYVTAYLLRLKVRFRMKLCCLWYIRYKFSWLLWHLMALRLLSLFLCFTIRVYKESVNCYIRGFVFYKKTRKGQKFIRPFLVRYDDYWLSCIMCTSTCG